MLPALALAAMVALLLWAPLAAADPDQVSGSRRCGLTWQDANSQCLDLCPDNDNKQCPEGLKCWSFLTDEACKVSSSGMEFGHGRRCGTTWSDANANCYQPCPDQVDAQCPPGLKCWSFLAEAHCTNKPVQPVPSPPQQPPQLPPPPPADEEYARSHRRCGASWEDANSKCIGSCPDNVNWQCPDGLKCWSDLSDEPCKGVPTAGQPPSGVARPPQDSTSKLPRPLGQAIPPEQRKTLVVYVFSQTDSEYWNNFMFFVREGMKLGPNEKPGDTQYVVIVQSQDPDREDVSRYPKLPENAMYVFHKNECYDWGTYGWLLHSNKVDVWSYTHFMFINCSVRGPFIPFYLQGVMDWKSAFLDLLVEDVKLVGPIISCEEVHLDQGDATNPHVQSYAVATDRVGLEILLNSHSVFSCHKEWGGAVLQAELGSSKLILDAGYNLGTFMLRYQGVDWRDQRNWGCNARRNPFKYYLYDGVDMNIFEVMFVKVKHSYRYMKVPYIMKALQVEKMLNATQDPTLQQRVRDKSDKQDAHDLAGKQVCFSQMRGARDCFNASSYRAEHSEYASLSDDEVWARYVSVDQFTEREARVECTNPPQPREIKAPLMVAPEDKVPETQLQ